VQGAKGKVDRELQKQAPLLDAILGYRDAGILPFHTPGHKLGVGLPAELMDSIGPAAALDASDEVFHPQSGHDVDVVREEAEELLAKAYGADWSSFLVNGTSQGIQAAFLALRIAGYDGSVLMPRNCHVSAIQALVLSGLCAKFVKPRFSRKWGIPLPPLRSEMEAALRNEGLPVFVTRPDYFGLCIDISHLCQIAHELNLPVLVDEAHGAHLGWHKGLPLPALGQGADLAVQSPHKLLGSLTGSSWLHLKSTLLGRDAVKDGLSLVTSTSPSHILLASLDGARRQIALQGEQLLSRTLRLALDVREEIEQISGLRCITCEEARELSDDFDPTKILIDVSDVGVTGPEAEKWLREACGVQVELATPRSVLAFITIGDTEESASRLVGALKRLPKELGRMSDRLGTNGEDTTPFMEWPMSETAKVSLRDAVLGGKEFVDFDQAAGQVAGEWLIPYPPGIPLLIPGERITLEIIEYYRYLRRMGVSVRGMADQTGRMVRVLRGKATD